MDNNTVKDLCGKVGALTNEQLIGCCVWLDREQKQARNMINKYKAELQARGLRIMDDSNTRYVKFYGAEGTAAIADSMSLEILNPDKLKACLGDSLFRMKVKETVKTDYKCDAKLERALKAIFTGDYTFEYTLGDFLDQMPEKPTPEQKGLLLKKLKGDYEKDKETLTSVLNLPEPPDGSLDVELWYIYRIKNAELIKAFIPIGGIDATVAEIRQCILVETKMAITIDYEDDKEDKGC